MIEINSFNRRKVYDFAVTLLKNFFKKGSLPCWRYPTSHWIGCLQEVLESENMNTIIVYVSMTGTTELMARSIEKELIKGGDQVIVKDAIETFAEELKPYERILIGSYTWGDGDLPDEAIDFYEELKNMNLTGKEAAVFGPGDSSYDHFARAVDIFEETLQKQGCHMITKGLKVDRDSEEELEQKCILFSQLIDQLDHSKITI